MGKKDSFQYSEDSEEVVTKSDSPQKQSVDSGVSLNAFLSNSKSEIVRKANNYLYIGFRKHCALQKFPYKASHDVWLDRFQKYLNK